MLPQALLFDEEYESHAFYQFRKARRWLEAAKAVVFVGTSFAVGVTEQALHVAEAHSLPVYSFNVTVEAPGRHEASSHEPLPTPVMHHIVGGCEVTLPRLAALVAAPRGTSAAQWYQGWVPSDAVAEALQALHAGEWREVTTGGQAESGAGRRSNRRGKKRDRPKAAPRHETMWVACDACGKWRRLAPGVVLPSEELQGKWRCKQNIWDRARQSCDAEEEPW